MVPSNIQLNSAVMKLEQNKLLVLESIVNELKTVISPGNVYSCRIEREWFHEYSAKSFVVFMNKILRPF
jgi:hypothetical protein